ncbi:MAG: dihydroneopterin aldolase [Chloroflexota bacterium]
MDKIVIHNLKVTGIIGIYPHERVTAQEMRISVILYTDTRRAAETDDIADCVDYDSAAKKITAHAQQAHRLTVEALAEDIARLCLALPGVKKVRVRVEKPHAVPEADSVGVEIERGPN